MIYKELVTIRGAMYIRTYSDTFTIMRDGEEYTEAIDPIGTERIYTETTNELPSEEEN